jgi:hypothetical protein
MLARKVRMLLAVTVATPLLFAACTDNGIFNPNQDASGTYQLSVFQGRRMPAHITYSDGSTLDVPSGSLVLSSNMTFVETNNYISTTYGQPPQNLQFSRSGQWTLNGTDLTLYVPAQNNNPSTTIAATLDVDSITYQEVDDFGVMQSYEYLR